uniref:Uncharacterized protein n=1 Tax=Oryza glaberrima TaxID=4538 RepID=I1PHJ3_ORYGL
MAIGMHERKQLRPGVVLSVIGSSSSSPIPAMNKGRGFKRVVKVGGGVKKEGKGVFPRLRGAVVATVRAVVGSGQRAMEDSGGTVGAMGLEVVAGRVGIERRQQMRLVMIGAIGDEEGPTG